ESVEGMAVTRDYFKVVGIQPALGRAFDDSDAPNAPQTVIILGHDLWQRRFNGNPNIIGQAVRISRHPQPLTVVGVMPPGVRFLPAPAESQEPNYNAEVSRESDELDRNRRPPGQRTNRRVNRRGPARTLFLLLAGR